MQGWPLTVDRSRKAANADVRMVAEICRYKHSVGVLAAMFGKYLQRSVCEFRRLICENAVNCTTTTHHRAACAQSGGLEARGGPLERAAARICRQGWAKVTRTTRLGDLNIQNLSWIDDRRVEVIALGLLLIVSRKKISSQPSSSHASKLGFGRVFHGHLEPSA